MRPAFFRSYVDAVNAFEAGREGDMALAGSFGIRYQVTRKSVRSTCCRQARVRLATGLTSCGGRVRCSQDGHRWDLVSRSAAGLSGSTLGHRLLISDVSQSRAALASSHRLNGLSPS